jgi:thiol:disulfide interchange protein
MFKNILCFLTFLALLPFSVLAQESLSADNVVIETLAPDVFSTNEESLVGLFFTPAEGWHVYWKNPGDSGAAPKFNFEGSNADVGPTLWPLPERLPVAHLVNLGYHGDVSYLFSVKPKDKNVTLKINLEWLVCKEECIPGFGQITLERPTGEKTIWNKTKQSILQKYAALIPSDEVSQAPIRIQSLTESEKTYSLKIDTTDAVDLSQLDVFPVNGEWVNPKKPTFDEPSKTFVFEKNNSSQKTSTLDWLVVYKSQAWEFKKVSVSNNQTIKSVKPTDFILICFFALLGGLVLNLMPCVFPVISIKAFSLLKSEKEDRVKECLSYSLGVLFTFTLLGLVFLLVRLTGTAVGWGFQLQYPPVIFGLVILFWLLAFNFLGYFEMGHSVMNLAGKYSSKSSSFGVGVLSVFIAAPCTGPFMGAALGAVINLPTSVAWLVFFFLGLGLALPFLFFAFIPQSMSWLPKPGAWMETLKQFFAFPLFATVIWLLWILGQQAGTQAWFLSAVALMIISFSLWLAQRRFKHAKIISWLIACTTVIFITYRFTQTLDVETDIKNQGAWSEFDEQKINEVRSKGQAVFVDYTAAWCITCQVNKQAVLNTEAAQKVFKEKNIYLVRADWTRYDAKITASLEKLGRNSVPVYAYYAAGAQDVFLLPQILTLKMIEELK